MIQVSSCNAEPSFTQPLMYKLIKARPNISKLYSENLVKAGVTTQEDAKVYV